MLPATRPIRAGPYDSAKVVYDAEQGVVGRISKCDGVWCRIEIGNRKGYIRMSDIWGVSNGEVAD